MTVKVGISVIDGDEIRLAGTYTKQEMQEYVERYISEMSIGNTTDWCGCQWLIHPDDVEKPEGQRRIRPGEPSEICPVHTKEGRILYFFEWLVKNAG